MTNPDDRRYTPEHNWILVEGPGAAIVGITWFAQDQLGEITFVDLPEPGERLEAGEAYGVIESMKSVSDLYAPLSGEVTAVNVKLVGEPTLVNSDPYGKGWLLHIRPDDDGAAASLLAAADYSDRVGAP
jgi:glycine cleavage system H protein